MGKPNKSNKSTSTLKKKSKLTSSPSKKRLGIAKDKSKLKGPTEAKPLTKSSPAKSKKLHSDSGQLTDVIILDSLKPSETLDRLTQRTWSLYRSSPLHKILPPSHLLDDPSFLLKHGSLIQPAVKKLRSFLNAEVSGIELPASSNGHGRMSVKTVKAWVANLPPLSGENSYLALTGFDISLESRFYPDLDSRRRNMVSRSSDSNSLTLENKIHFILVTYTALGSEVPFSLILTKGLTDGVSLGLQWLAGYCDARVSQFYLAPHQLQPLFTTSLASILNYQTKSPEEESISFPPAELKFQFDSRMFLNQELELMNINIPWNSLLEFWKKLHFKQDDPIELITREQAHVWGLQVQTYLESHITRCSGIPVSTLMLRRIGTPILVAQCYGKLKLLSGFPSTYYLLLMRLIFRQSQ